jgi:DNA-binding NarL/FixJ family response regulator
MIGAATTGASAVDATAVLLVHEDDVFLWGLQRLIEKQHPRLVHAGTASTVDEAVALLPHARPRVILLDLELSGASNLQVLSTMVKASNVAVIGFTSSRNPETLQAGLLVGAKGVMKKTAKPVDILRAIDKVCEGELWTNRATIQRIFEALSSAPRSQHLGQQKVHGLTARECEVVIVLSKSPNKPLKSIAPALGVSESTLRNHLSSIYEKLQVSGRLDLYVYAQKHGLDSLV